MLVCRPLSSITTDMLRSCQGPVLPPAVAQFRRPRRPWRGLLSRALPISDGRASEAGTAGSDGEAQTPAQPGASKERTAPAWPRVIADVRDNSYESAAESEQYSWFDDKPSSPGQAAKSREAFLLRLATLGFGVRCVKACASGMRPQRAGARVVSLMAVSCTALRASR